MNKILSFLLVVSLVLVGFSVSPSVARAVTPSLSLSATGSGDSVQLTVNGDANANVSLYYQRSGYGYQTQFIGTTNYNGYLTTTVSTANYGISYGSWVRVIVNNQSSVDMAWPNNYNNYNYSYGYGAVTLSQSSLTLAVGQSTNITISGGNLPYAMTYPNAINIFQPIIAGNILTVTGLNSGSGSLNVCSTGGTGCATLAITVTAYNNGINYYNNNSYYNYPVTPITFSQSSAALSIGQSINVTIYGGAGSGYYVLHNSNTSGVTTTITGSTLTLTGLSNTAAGIVVCSASNNCGALSVIVGPTNTNNYNTYTSQNQNGWTYCGNEGQTCNVPGTQTVRYGANGNYYYRTITGRATCTNKIFGDPLFGVAKQCSYGGAIY